jgi:hypothetical protein
MPTRSRSRSRSAPRPKNNTEKNKLEKESKLVKNYQNWLKTDPTQVDLRLGARHGYPTWGNIQMMEERRAEARMTPAERAAKAKRNAEAAAKAEAARLKAAQNILVSRARAHMMEKTERFVNRRTGKMDPAKRIFSVCKKAFEPAADGFPAGCFAHTAGRCPWFHPGEPGYDAVCSGAVAGPTKETSAAHSRRRNTTRKSKK